MATTITQTFKKISGIEKEMAGKELGEEILRLRLKAGWSQEELAERIDLHQSRVSRLENGEHNYPLETVYRLAVAFDINPFELAAIYWGVEVVELPNKDKETLDKFINLAIEYLNSHPLAQDGSFQPLPSGKPRHNLSESDTNKINKVIQGRKRTKIKDVPPPDSE